MVKSEIDTNKLATDTKHHQIHFEKLIY